MKCGMYPYLSLFHFPRKLSIDLKVAKIVSRSVTSLLTDEKGPKAEQVFKKMSLV